MIAVAGEPVGSVARIDQVRAPTCWLYASRTGRIGLVPFVRAIVPTVDVPGGRVVIDPPDGLLELCCMRVDIVTIFPEYLAPLDLSLLGKARADGRLQVGVHDLRHVDP